MKCFSFLLLFFVLLNPAFAQDTSKTKDNELKHGIQFQVQGLLNLTNFNGYTFSYRYLFNKCSGLRIGVFSYLNNEDYDVTQQVDTISIKPLYYYNNYNFKVSIQYLQSIIDYENFALIIGGGPFVSFSKRDSRWENLYSSYTRKYIEKDKSTSYGLDIILGVECQLFTNVFLSGEYGLTLLKESSEVDYEVTEVGTGINYISKQSGDRDRLLIRNLGVNLGIAVFF